jgi:acetone carboxylase gamma subunit
MADEKQTTSWPMDILRDLIEGRLDPEKIKDIQSKRKDEDRFEKILELEQKRVPWKEKVIVPLAEHLYVVLKKGQKIVKCSCGYEFGDCRQNWKLNALVYERNPQDGEIYDGPRGGNPNWMILREFYCPGCGTQLEVENLPPGYPILFDAQLDIDGFYAGRPELRKKVFGD